MARPIKTLVHEFPWIHLGLGLSGNLAFFVGSVLFLPAFEPWKTVGVWLFIAGAGLMLVGAAGSMTAKLLDGHLDRGGRAARSGSRARGEGTSAGAMRSRQRDR